MKNYYKEKLKSKLISNYIAEHRRAPTKEQVFDLLRKQGKKFVNVNKVGFSGYNVTFPEFGEPASASGHSQNRQAIRDD